MIPISHFMYVIQAERERDLERWQLARAAALSETRRPAASLSDRVRMALGSWSLAVRPEDTRAPSTERSTSIVACC